MGKDAWGPGAFLVAPPDRITQASDDLLLLAAALGAISAAVARVDHTYATRDRDVRITDALNGMVKRLEGGK